MAQVVTVSHVRQVAAWMRRWQGPRLQVIADAEQRRILMVRPGQRRAR